MEEIIDNDVVIYKDPDTDIISVFWRADERFTIDEVAKRVTPEGVKYKIVKESDLPTTDIFQETWEYDFENSYDGVGVSEEDWQEITSRVLNNIIDISQ
jgi:hypothetical protein